MKQKLITLEEFCYNNKNPLINGYFNNLLINTVQLSEYWKHKEYIPTILDFGCNCKQLKKILQGFKFKYNTKFFNYKGYDIDRKYTEIEDYTKIKPDFIFCINVLEHLTLKELEKTFNNFRKMNKNVTLITSIPIMNILSNFLNNNFDRVNENKKFEIHKSKYKDIQNILRRKFVLLREKNYFMLQKIQVWRFK